MGFTELVEVYRYYTWFQVNNLHFEYNNYDPRQQCSTIQEVVTRLKIKDQLERLLHKKIAAAAKAEKSTESEDTTEGMPDLVDKYDQVVRESSLAVATRYKNRAAKKQRILEAIDSGQRDVQYQLRLTPTDYCDATAGYNYAHDLPTGFTQLADIRIEQGKATIRDWSTL